MTTTYTIQPSIFDRTPWAVEVHEDGKHANTIYFASREEAEKWVHMAMRAPHPEEPTA